MTACCQHVAVILICGFPVNLCSILQLTEAYKPAIKEKEKKICFIYCKLFVRAVVRVPCNVYLFVKRKKKKNILKL